MTSLLRSIITFAAALLCQITVIPSLIADPFKPNLLLVVVVWVSLTVSTLWGALLVYLIGMIQDSVSGLCLGLNGVSYLLLFLVLHRIANRLYAESRYLMTLSVFLATLACGISQLILLALFSSAGGIVTTLVSSLVPQSLVNAFAASLFFTLLDETAPEESR